MSRARLTYSIHIGVVLFGRIRIMHLMCAHENLMECGESAKFENFADLQAQYQCLITVRLVVGNDGCVEWRWSLLSRIQ
jgi:hypothetical protein